MSNLKSYLDHIDELFEELNSELLVNIGKSISGETIKDLYYEVDDDMTLRIILDDTTIDVNWLDDDEKYIYLGLTNNIEDHNINKNITFGYKLNKFKRWQD